LEIFSSLDAAKIEPGEIDPETNALHYPDGTITRYKDIMKTFNGNSTISQKDLILIIITEMDELGKFNQ
jgi:hypothetical protein